MFPKVAHVSRLFTSAKLTKPRLLTNSKALKPSPLQQLSTLGLYITPKRGFFWGKKKEEPELDPEQVSKDFANMSSLGPMIQKIVDENKGKPPLLPKQQDKYKGKLTVVVEMDDVLLHTFYPDDREGYLHAPQRDFDFYMDFPEYGTFLSVYKRENLAKFLEYLQENCEAVIFSAGVKLYVDKVMDLIDSKKEIFPYRLYQDSCNRLVYEEEDVNEYLKDMNRLGRDLKRTVLIDARPFAFWCNPDNGIPIAEYMANDPNPDKQLLHLINVLEDLKEESDVRNYLSEKYSIKEALEQSKMV
eukprot:TRINITY_DN13286_c0_g1_i2.p1 TRINITY_DN13286_c0_g1~~TRINITY_DN13286_c0_g1_i2.p1  ORF type:complete len:301 (+),score=63.87 TRINITY_DN13286_c0_g1_i2:159-1061(+)